MPVKMKSPFVRNANYAPYDGATIKRRIRAQSESNAERLVTRAKKLYMPKVTGKTIASARVEKFGQNGFAATSINYSENERNSNNPYPSDGRYGFTTSSNPYNVDKHHWFTRSHEDLSYNFLLEARKVREE